MLPLEVYCGPWLKNQPGGGESASHWLPTKRCPFVGRYDVHRISRGRHAAALVCNRVRLAYSTSRRAPRRAAGSSVMAEGVRRASFFRAPTEKASTPCALHVIPSGNLNQALRAVGVELCFLRWLEHRSNVYPNVFHLEVGLTGDHRSLEMTPTHSHICPQGFPGCNALYSPKYCACR
jgi:hypothetical protein